MKNEKLVKRWFKEVWNNKNEEAIDELFSKTGIAHGLMDEDNNEIVGPEKFKIFFRKFIRSFPDINVKVEDTISEGRKITARTVVRLTHSGESFTVSEGRSIASSGKSIEFTGTAIMRIKDDQIQEAWNNYDFLTFYMQLGAI